MFGCQQVLIHTEPDTQSVIEYVCSESNKVFNCALYYARQIYFKAHRYISKAELDAELKMRDAVKKAARLVIKHCLENQIGTVVFGWNQGQKQEANLGSKNHQKWVQVPTARLKNRISQLGEQYGIQLVETEESYTSKTSFVDGDYLPKYGEKPDNWKPSGRRVKRGLYRTALNWYINADCNGAANILRKVSRMLGLNLSGLSRVSLTAPQRVFLWSAKRKRCSDVVLTRRGTSA